VRYEVYGATGIYLVARRCRQLGDGTIVNDMAKEMRKAARPAIRAIRKHETEILPHRGGLNLWVAKASIRTKVFRGPRTAGVRLMQSRKSTKGKADLRGMDGGKVRHPVFGNRSVWVGQGVPPGMFTDVDGKVIDEFRDGIVVAVDRAVSRLL
jgi:hypothetical protein